MNETIQSKLAIQIAQLSLDKATVEAKLEQVEAERNILQAQVSELQGRLTQEEVSE